MTCEEALVLISGHIDQENTPEEEAMLQAHLESCEACRSVMDAFLDIEKGISQLEEPPAELRENVMKTIRAESSARKKKAVKRWSGIAVAAALVVVIGIGAMGLPGQSSQPADTAAPMVARAMPQPAEMTAADVPAALVDMPSVLPQELAEQRQADVAVTYDLLPEMEVCTCETLENGALLYLLESADGAVNLSRTYGVELYQPSVHKGDCSYALLMPRN